MSLSGVYRGLVPPHWADRQRHHLDVRLISLSDLTPAVERCHYGVQWCDVREYNSAQPSAIVARLNAVVITPKSAVKKSHSFNLVFLCFAESLLCYCWIYKYLETAQIRVR